MTLLVFRKFYERPVLCNERLLFTISVILNVFSRFDPNEWHHHLQMGDIVSFLISLNMGKQV